MKELVYPHEKTLGAITLVLGLFVWLGLVVGTFGVAIIILIIGFFGYLFAQSALIAHIRGNGVELTSEQFPDLYQQFAFCCDKLEIKERPKAYILNGNGGLNAFATQFLGIQYVVLYSDVVDAMREHTDGVKFYIGHELGHLRMKHLTGSFLRWPVLWLPLLGAAYSRARESTCDRHGLACSSAPESAAKSLFALAAGSERWQGLDVPSYIKQSQETSGFWMSFHELTAGYPWISKRVARVVDINSKMPSRNPMAYVFALFIPYAGRLGGAFALLALVYIVGILAAVAIPQYQNYVIQTKLSVAVIESQQARDALASYYDANEEIPESLDMLGIETQGLQNNAEMFLDTDNMVLTVELGKESLIFIPSLDDDGHVVWSCQAGEETSAKRVPASCIDL